MKKHWILLLTLVVLLFAAVSLSASAASSNKCGDNVTWALDGNGTLTISGTGKMSDYKQDEAPWCANKYQYQVCKVHISDGVTNIGDFAFFRCRNIKSITIPDSVTSIGSYAFCGCRNIKSITIPNGVTSIGEQAFYGCSSLASITIPDSVTSIGYDAFDSSLSSVYINDISAWCKIIFHSYTANPLYYGHNLYCGGKLITDLVIPDGVKSIYSFAFYGCSSLTSITIPDSVTSIGKQAFSRCSNLTSITIPDSVTSIRYDAFDYCSSLSSVYINDISAWCKIIFESYTANPLYYGHNLYCGGKLITDLVIPDGVTSIGNYAFYGCRSLTSITIPDSVTSIGDSAFSLCSSLTSITIPDSVTSIGNSAFYGCKSLTSITIPNSVTSIGGKAFYGCSNLKSITLAQTNIGKDAFAGVNKLAQFTVYFPYKTASASFLGDGFYKGQITDVVLKENVKYIEDSAFMGCAALKTVTIPGSVETIGSNAFQDSGVEKLIFEGDAPVFKADSFFAQTMTVEYPAYASGWSSVINHDYGGIITWKARKNPFTDVAKNSWYFEDVMYAYSHGLFSGTTANKFEPNTKTSRAMIVTVLWRIDGERAPSGKSSFKDVKKTAWYGKAVLWAADNNIVSGTSQGIFSPDQAVTREQIAKILYGYAEYKGYSVSKTKDITKYPDYKKVSKWAAPYLAWANAEGLITGAKVGTKTLLDPQGEATRAVVASILVRFVKTYQ